VEKSIKILTQFNNYNLRMQKSPSNIDQGGFRKSIDLFKPNRDIVLVQDNSAFRGNWKLGQVAEVKPGKDSIIRDVAIRYKNVYAISSLIIFHSLVFRGQPRPKPINKGAL
jgi:hypothetical protein